MKLNKAFLSRINRILCLLIFPLALFLLFTGYASTRSYGLNHILRRRYSLPLHMGLPHYIFMGLVAVHLAISSYFAIKRTRKIGFNALSFKVRGKFSLNKFLLIVNRTSAWSLLMVFIVFIATGFSMTGKFWVNRIISPEFASFLHKTLDWPMIMLLLVHSSISFYAYFIKSYICRTTK